MENSVGGMLLSAFQKKLGLSRKTVYRLRKSGELRAVKRGGLLFVSEAAIKEFFGEAR